MNGIVIDLILVGILIIFSIIGMYKGFFSTLLSLLGFVGTLLVSFIFRDEMVAVLDSIFNLTGWLTSVVGSSVAKVLAVIIGIALTYIIIRLVIYVLNHTIGKLFKGKVLGKANAFLGMFVGFCKGAMYTCFLFAVISVATLIPSVNSFVQERLQGSILTCYVYIFVEQQIANNFKSGIETDDISPATNPIITISNGD